MRRWHMTDGKKTCRPKRHSKITKLFFKDYIIGGKMCKFVERTLKTHFTMALEQQIQKDIMEAMKAHDESRLNATRGIKSEILLAKTSGAEHELSDADVLKIIQKLVKQRKESAELYTQGNRPELAEKELAELKVMEAYLPKALSEEEVRNVLKEVVAEVGATSPKDMGKVMGAATKKLAGQADGKLISTIVKELLAQ